uniref:hypothetical protein n=1 Tax=Streptomyces sp. CA-141956 TaxID=3240051 RepID=UPI003F49458A
MTAAEFRAANGDPTTWAWDQFESYDLLSLADYDAAEQAAKTHELIGGTTRAGKTALPAPTTGNAA